VIATKRNSILIAIVISLVPIQVQAEEIIRIVKATAYNATAQQTDSTPTICAWGDKIRPGIIAVSRDLEKLGLTRGTKVHIEGIGTRIVLDRMHRRKKNQIDIYMEDYNDAVNFGIKKVTISWTKGDH
jgi:3D (Asp-Asp-Asp) domain-containing protein